MNLALKVRKALNLDKRDAGVLLFGYKSRDHAWRMFNNWEAGKSEIPVSTKYYFNLILYLIGSEGADRTIEILNRIKN